jgi:uncharacterized membrane protein YdjX (TVP38/TMEM64 family)
MTKESNVSIIFKVFCLFALFGIIILLFIYKDNWVNYEPLKYLVTDYGIWSYLFFILLQILQSIVVIIPLTPITISGGIVFGATLGSILSWTGVFLGQLLAFSISRWAGRYFVLNKINNKHFINARNYIDKIMQKEKGGLIITMFYLSCLVSFDIISYSLGLTIISWKKAALMIGIGIIPKIILLNILGGNIFTDNDNEYEIYITIVIFVIVLTTLFVTAMIKKHLK